MEGIKGALKFLRGQTVETETAKESINSMLRDSGLQGFSLQPKSGVDHVYEVRRPDGTIADNLSEGEKNLLHFCISTIWYTEVTQRTVKPETKLWLLMIRFLAWIAVHSLLSVRLYVR